MKFLKFVITKTIALAAPVSALILNNKSGMQIKKSLILNLVNKTEKRAVAIKVEFVSMRYISAESAKERHG